VLKNAMLSCAERVLKEQNAAESRRRNSRFCKGVIQKVCEARTWTLQARAREKINTVLETREICFDPKTTNSLEHATQKR
jgi:hypothetical protein